jgi:hypothetical protein
MPKPRWQSKGDSKFIGSQRAGAPTSGCEQGLIKNLNTQVGRLKQTTRWDGLLVVSFSRPWADPMIQDMSNHSTKDASLWLKVFHIGTKECFEGGGSPKAGVPQMEPTKTTAKFGNATAHVIVAYNHGWIGCMSGVLTNIVEQSTDQHDVICCRNAVRMYKADLAQPNLTKSQIYEREITTALTHQIGIRTGLVSPSMYTHFTNKQSRESNHIGKPSARTQKVEVLGYWRMPLSITRRRLIGSVDTGMDGAGIDAPEGACCTNTSKPSGSKGLNCDMNGMGDSKLTGDPM